MDDSQQYLPVHRIIGLVFPVYVFGLPLIVTRFIGKLQVPPGSYVFAVATHGGMPCATLNQAARLFSKKGVLLSSGFDVLMVDNATQIADIISPEKQRRRFEKAGRKIAIICAAIENGKRSMDHGWPLVNWLFSRIYRNTVPVLPGFDRNFHIDTNCNGCGLCAQACPMGNIQMLDRRPVWQQHCEQCLACFHWCPKTAIQYGEKTAGRARYHHPDVRLGDILER